VIAHRFYGSESGELLVASGSVANTQNGSWSSGQRPSTCHDPKAESEKTASKRCAHLKNAR